MTKKCGLRLELYAFVRERQWFESRQPIVPVGLNPTITLVSTVTVLVILFTFVENSCIGDIEVTARDHEQKPAGEDASTPAAKHTEERRTLLVLNHLDFPAVREEER